MEAGVDAEAAGVQATASSEAPPAAAMDAEAAAPSPADEALSRAEQLRGLFDTARNDAATGLLDLKRLAAMLTRIRAHIVHQPLDHLSPLSVAVMLEIGRETVYGEASDAILAEAEAAMIEEALA